MAMKIVKQGRRRRAIAAAATAAAAAAAIGVAVPALAVSAGTGSARVLGAGQTGNRAQVPWRLVGPGWSMALFSASTAAEGIKPTSGPETLYLVDPAGGRYKMISWRARSPQTKWYLQAWSGDLRRAMFVPEGSLNNPYVRQQVFQLQLRTGKISRFTLPLRVSALSYSRPDGLNILTEKGFPGSTNKVTLQRYDLTGKLAATLATVQAYGTPAYRPDGAELAASGPHGLVLISNGGGVIRQLRVEGGRESCTAVRWWTDTKILASCIRRGQYGYNMWIVPASGAAATVLTPAHKTFSFDEGDFNAWKLSSGLYVDGYGACATLVIGKYPVHGPEQMVTVPGAASSLIVTATRSQLQVERINGCEPGVSLVWFNPATRKLTVAIGVHGHQIGVTSVVPFFVTGKF
jgi:hypothetical protein